MLGIGRIILLWHSLGLPYTYFGAVSNELLGMQPHGLASFPTSVQLPKLAVGPVPGRLPKQVVVPGSPQLPGLGVVLESTQLH